MGLPLESISFLAVGLSGGLGVLAGFYLRRMIIESRIDSVENLAKKILDEARKDAEAIKKETALQAKDQLFQMKVEFDKESKERRLELNILEKRLLQKEEHLEKKISILISKNLSSATARNRLKPLKRRSKNKQHIITIWSRNKGCNWNAWQASVPKRPAISY